MELGELKVFVTVATEHSFSRAALKLCRTQPAVSQAVRRLEEDLGELLFDRSTKSAKLTQAGNTLLPEAIHLLRMADEAVATVRQLSQRDRAVLRIGGDETDAQILLPALSTVLLQQPHLSVEFRRVADLDVLAEVGARTIDIGITTRERVPAPLCSVPVPVLSPGLCVLLPKSHPLASWPELPVTVLHSERLVTLAGLPLPESAMMSATDDAAPPAGACVVMPGLDSLKHAVVNGLGIGVVPRDAVSSLIPAGLVAIPLPATRAGGARTLVYRDTDGQRTAVEDFLEALRCTAEDRASRTAPIAMRAAR
ncbi:MAG: LysR family transcriptional regulator [Vicinamibacterales bacterium]